MKKKKWLTIGVTFDPRESHYIAGILHAANLEARPEGTSAGGYWISATKAHARQAIERIETDFRFREGDMNVALIDPEQLLEEWTMQRIEKLVGKLPGPRYQQLSRESLERWHQSLQ